MAISMMRERGRGRWQFPLPSPRRSVALLLLALAALPGDGGALALHAPSGPVTARPPMSDADLERELERFWTSTRPRVLLDGLARQYVRRPESIRAALRMLHAATDSGRRDWLRDFTRAVGRRQPTAANLLLRAEIEFAEHGYEAGLAYAAAAHLRAPDLLETAASYAAALAGSGRPLAAFELLAGSSDSEPWSDLPLLTLQRLSVIVATAAPDSLGEAATTAWLTRARQAGNASFRVRGLAVASSLAWVREDDAAAVALAEEGLAGASRASSAHSAALAVMQAASLRGVAAPGVGRMEGVCQQLPDAARAARDDCLVTALRRVAGAASLRPVLRINELLQHSTARDPILTMRYGSAMIPLLELLGAHREAVGLAELASAAAGEFGVEDLRISFDARLARARRMSGDYPGAIAAASRVLEKADPSSFPARRALAEAAAAGRAARGEATLDDLLAIAVAVQEEASEPGSTAEDLVPGGSAFALTNDPLGLVSSVAAARAAEEAGELDAAIDSYLQAIDMAQRLRRSAGLSLMMSAALNDVWQGVGRRALQLAIEADDASLALDILERGRQLSDARRPPQEASKFRLPRRSLIVAYVVGTARPRAIVVRDGAVGMLDLPLSTRALRDRVTIWRQLAAQEQKDGRWRRLTESLARDLLQPIESSPWISGVDQLLVVPDDILHLVPFATLAAARPPAKNAGRLVVQSPSVATMLRALRIRAREGAMVAFGLGGGSGLVAEMQAVRQAGGRVLIGPQATETAWRRQAARAEILHFGGHAGVTTPGARGLQLVADRHGDGLLTIADIMATPLPGSTVVLLGCDTATRVAETGASTFYRQNPSLGEAFLHAGARSVVGHLWPITEEDARLLAEAFYRAGGPRRGIAALEEARATLAERFPHLPRRWAGAVWLGSPGPSS